MNAYHVLEDDDEGETGREHVPVLGTEAVGVLLVAGPVAVAAVLAGGRRVELLLLVAHIRRVVRRVELRKRAVDVALQVLRLRVHESVNAARYKVRRVGYHECLCEILQWFR